MKKLKRFFGLFTTIALIVVMTVSVVACGTPADSGSTDEPPAPAVAVEITGGEDTISQGATMSLSATVTGTDNTAVTWKVSDPVTLRITDDGVVSVLSEPEILNKLVTITATSVADTRAYATKTITVLAPKKSGQVGYLTTALLEKISGDNLTVSGTVTDKYVDTHISANNRTNVYNMSVKMEDGKWSGAWNSQGGNTLNDTYYKGTRSDVKYTVTDIDGNVLESLDDGHSIEKEIVTKDNEVTRKTITDYMSRPVAWESQHYWNHLSSFNNLINDTKITYDPDDPTRYEYNLNENNSEEFFLMAYLAQSLTPMLDSSTEWFRTVVFVLDDAHENIVSVQAQTNPSYSGVVTDQQGNIKDYDTMQVCEVNLSFSEIGTTAIESKKAYDAPDNADKLISALNKMKAATSYVFEAEEKATYEAMPDDGDYSVDFSSAPVLNAARDGDATFTYNDNPYNYKSASGTVGLRGYITPDAAIIARTGKYSSGMDDKLYHTEYTGYRQFDGYYEEFAYYAKTKKENNVSVIDKQGMQGTKRISGSYVQKVLPKFDFSANLFKFAGSSGSGDNAQYRFVLQEADITRDIAKEISMHSYADDGNPDSANALTITVDGNGNLISTSFPYEITTAYGVITTKYAHINSTAIDLEKIDTNYIERGAMASWGDYEMKLYRDANGEYERDADNMVIDPDAATAIQSIFGAKAGNVPAPTVFKSVFEDYISGPFYEDDKKEINGQEKYVRYMSLKAEATVHDENMQLPDEMFAPYHTKIVEAMNAAGLDPVPSKTDVTGGKTGYSDRVMVFANDNITIRVENNHTKWFDFEIYLTEDYTR